MTMGTKNTPSDTGYNGKDLDTIKRGGPPVQPSDQVAIGLKGEIYVSDGYGNARVHIFSPKGELKRSWGEPGSGPGQFHLAHGIAVAADGRVFVCDREADRIQIFSPDGEFLSEWKADGALGPAGDHRQPPGAGQMIGIALVAKSPPDGYTLVMTSTPLALNTVLYKKVPYDPIRDFVPITQIAAMPNLLVTHPTLPARSPKR